MFSGLVKGLGKVGTIKKRRLSVWGPKARYEVGESIAIDGVCLTLVKPIKKPKNTELWFDISPETLDKTTLGRLKNGDLVNLERALTFKDFLGGHLVQGHVDGVGKVAKIKILGSNKEIWFKGPREILKYIVLKGSVAVNGVSLTAVKVKPTEFSVALIPTTLRSTNLGKIKIGTAVNLEADIMAKYIERFLRK